MSIRERYTLTAIWLHWIIAVAYGRKYGAGMERGLLAR